MTGVISVRPGHRGIKQDPPLKLLVEAAESDARLAMRIRQRIRDRLVVTTDIHLVPPGSLPRSEDKSRLVDFCEADAPG